MIRYGTFATLVASFLLTPAAHGETNPAEASRKIVLVAGETAKVDVVGHHDYLAGCKCLELLTAKPRV